MKLTLYFDTETTGFVQQSMPPDHPSQPHLVQLGCVLADETGRELAAVELIVRPEGYQIPAQAAAVHGVTTELATACGVPLATALSVFCKLREVATEMVAFNLAFDELVMAAAIARSGRTPSHHGPATRHCAMLQAMPIMELPPTARMLAAGFDKFKPPNLTEAYKFFVDEKGFTGAHGALADTRACMAVYRAIQQRPSS